MYAEEPINLSIISLKAITLSAIWVGGGFSLPWPGRNYAYAVLAGPHNLALIMIVIMIILLNLI